MISLGSTRYYLCSNIYKTDYILNKHLSHKGREFIRVKVLLTNLRILRVLVHKDLLGTQQFYPAVLCFDT